MTEDRRLIEEFLPVRAISFEATREKSLRRRDYHLSMLHLWWARRPLAAARAAVYSTLLPAQGRAEDPKQLTEFMTALTHWSAISKKAGFTMGAAENVAAKAKEEILAQYGNPPKVLDCFAGGGAIPLEIGRLGGQAYAVELNPVAYLILLCTLVYPQTFGPSLADDIDKWGTWLVERARSELADLYPGIPLGEEPTSGGQLSLDSEGDPGRTMLTAVAYLWTRTVPCPNPALPPHDLHLVRQTWLRKKPKLKSKDGFVALKPVVNHADQSVDWKLVSSKTEEGLGFDPAEGSERGDAACLVCGASVTADEVKVLAKGGKLGRSLLAIGGVVAGKRGKEYVTPDVGIRFVPADEQVEARLSDLLAETGLTIPDARLAVEDNQHFQAPMYGMMTVGELFTKRQVLSLLTFCKLVRQAHDEMVGGGMDPERAKAVATFLAMAVDRVADRGSTICHWNNARETTENTFARQALPMTWDFPETNPFGGSSGDLTAALEQVAKVARHCSSAGEPAVVVRGSATDPVPGGPFDAVITDPPYYDNISYADLSDFFYSWLQRSIGHLYPEHLAAPITPKKKEVVAANYRYGGKDEAKQAYDDMMAEVFARRRDELKPGAPLVVVYAHKTYYGWATLVNALRRAGFTVTEAWPLDTEMPTRSVGQGTASLASSIFLVARKRESNDVGDWASHVYPELQQVVAERIEKLPGMGVTGDDLIIAAVGAGLRAYTRYARVELPNGEELPPEAYLDEVQREVIETILSDVFDLEKSGVKVVDASTQFYVMGRFEFGAAWAEFDKANTLGKGIGVELTGRGSILSGSGALLTKEKGKVKLRDFQDRGRSANLGIPDEDNPNPPLIDVLHRLLWLTQREPQGVKEYLLEARPDTERLRVVAQALAGKALSRKGAGTSNREEGAIASLLGSWKRIIEENLFSQGEAS